MSRIFTIWGTPTGSSRMQILRDDHGRIKLNGTTDFGETHCVFTDVQAAEIRDAITELLQ